MTIWKVSGQSEKFLKCPESFQTGKFLDNLEGLDKFGKSPDSLERQRYVITWSNALKLTTNKVAIKYDLLVAIMIIHFWNLCHKIDLRTFGICRGNDLRTSSGKF